MADARLRMTSGSPHEPATMWTKHALLVACMLMSACESAESSCEFKGISVGDATTPTELMAELGISNFATDLKSRPTAVTAELARRIGFTAASEVNEWSVGPTCDNDSCTIPFGLGIADGNIPASVFVSFPKGHIDAISVRFNQIYWADIKAVLHNKYGADWKTETDSGFVITDYETRERLEVERTILHQSHSLVDSSDGSSCMIRAISYDSVFTHRDPLGLFQSAFEIKRIPGAL